MSEDVAQRISGHKTKAVFSRYNVTSETDLKDAARRMDVYLAGKLAEGAQRAETRNPLAM